MKDQKVLRKQRVRRYLLMIGGLITLIIASGELFARFYLGLGDPPLSVTHPQIEYMFKPNQDVYRFGNHQLYNQYGMRSPAFDRKKNGDEYRIMIFGDSIINGGNLTDHRDLATTIIADKLSEKLKKPVIVGNISAGSWGPGNWLAYAKEYGYFEADVIVLVISSHDAGDNPSFTPLNPNTHPTSRPFSALGEAITRYLPKYIPALRAKAPDSEKLSVEQPQKEAARKKGIADLEEFLKLSLRNTPRVFVLQHLEKAEIEDRSIKPGYFAIRELCQKLAIECRSLEPLFRASMEQGVTPYRIGDSIHPNQEGQQIIANEVIKILAD